MNNFRVGMEYHKWFNITKEIVMRFTELTGDKNPIHLNEEYAATTRFKKCIVPGMLIAGLLSKIIGMDFPGNGSIYLGQDLKFVAPIYIGDKIKITCIIAEISSKKHLIINNIVETEGGKVVIEGTSRVKMLKD